METNIQLTDNLFLESIDENYYEDEKLITVGCYFSFFGHESCAYVRIDNLKSDQPSYAMIESPDEVHSSLVDLLKEDHIWSIIYAQVTLYIKWWNEQQTN